MTRAVAMLSGGLDSAVATALFREQAGQHVDATVFFAYGQRAQRPEEAAAQALAARWQVEFVRLDLPWLGQLAARCGSALVCDSGEPLPQGTVDRPGDGDSARAVWVPARNAVFVSAAAAVAESLGADCVLAGFNREEAATFADNSAAFVQAGSAFLATGTRSGVKVVSPTLHLDKAELVAAAKRLGFAAADFWSCYDGGEQPCGRCESCLRSHWDR